MPDIQHTIAERLSDQFGPRYNITWRHTGGGIYCLIIIDTDGCDSYNEETSIYVGDAAGNLGWTDFYGDEHGEWPTLTWDSDPDIIAAVIAATARAYFNPALAGPWHSELLGHALRIVAVDGTDVWMPGAHWWHTRWPEHDDVLAARRISNDALDILNRPYEDALLTKAAMR